MMLQERLLIRTWSCTSPRGLTCLNRLGDLAARGTLIGPCLFCQDLGLSWKSTSSRAGCVYASYRGLEKHLSDRSLWADCHSVGRKPENIRRSFAGRTLEQKPNVFVPFRFVLYRSGFFRRHRVSDDEDSPHCSHVTARHDPKRALIQSGVPDAGRPNRLFHFRARSRVRDV